MFWMYLHLAAVIVSALTGAWVLGRPKGTSLHRQVGRIYAGAMMMASLSSLKLPATIKPLLLDYFGAIHILSVAVVILMPVSIMCARAGRIRSHRRIMMGTYIGGILVAGGFAVFSSGRLLNDWLF